MGKYQSSLLNNNTLFVPYFYCTFYSYLDNKQKNTVLKHRTIFFSQIIDIKQVVIC